MPDQLSQQYKELKGLAAEALAGRAVARLIAVMALQAREILQQIERVELNSRVVGKQYFSFRRIIQSRPVNQGLYVDDAGEFNRLLRAFRRRILGHFGRRHR